MKVMAMKGAGTKKVPKSWRMYSRGFSLSYTADISYLSRYGNPGIGFRTRIKRK